MKKPIIMLLLASMAGAATAQVKLGSNPATMNSGTVLELESTNKALLLPRMTTAQQILIPQQVAGMMLYNTDSTCLNQYNGTSWQSMCKTGSNMRIFSDTNTANIAAPTTKVSGNLIYDLSCGCNKVFYNNGWRSVGDFALSRVFTDTASANTATPTTRTEGMIIYDRATNSEKIFIGGKWITPGANPVNYVFADTTLANNSAPSIKNEGQQVFITSCNCLQVFHNNKWVTANGTDVAFTAVSSSSPALLTISGLTNLLSGNAVKQVNFGVADYNIGSAYNTSSTESAFTAPTGGVYPFNVGILTGINVGLLGSYNFGITVNDEIKFSQPLAIAKFGSVLNVTSQAQGLISKDLLLVPGDVVRVVVITSGLNIGINLQAGSTYFDGHLTR